MRDFFLENLDVDFFPSLEEIEIVDVLLYIGVYFNKHYETKDYKSVIYKGLSLQNIEIDNELFDKHYAQIVLYLDWFIEFMKETKFSKVNK